MTVFTTSILDNFSKSYGLHNLVDKSTIINDAGHHSYVYEEYVENNLDGIMSVKTGGFIKILDYKIEVGDIKFMEPQKKPFRVPILMNKKYHAYYQPFMLYMTLETTGDINLIKLKNYELYSKLFTNDGLINILTTNKIRSIIRKNVDYLLK